MRTILIALLAFVASFGTAQADDKPLWDLARDAIPAELQSGAITKTDGGVVLRDGAAFGVPGARGGSDQWPQTGVPRAQARVVRQPNTCLFTKFAVT